MPFLILYLQKLFLCWFHYAVCYQAIRPICYHCNVMYWDELIVLRLFDVPLWFFTVTCWLALDVSRTALLRVITQASSCKFLTDVSGQPTGSILSLRCHAENIGNLLPTFLWQPIGSHLQGSKNSQRYGGNDRLSWNFGKKFTTTRWVTWRRKTCRTPGVVFWSKGMEDAMKETFRANQTVC
jgi:hypothetical protein